MLRIGPRLSWKINPRGEVADFVDIYPTEFVGNSIHSDNISASPVGELQIRNECIRLLDAHWATTVDRTKICIPLHRGAIAVINEEDLVEEIARLAGYENIESALPPSFEAGEYQPHEHRERKMRQVLADLSFDEAISYSFIDTKHDDIFEPAPGVFQTGSGMVTLQDSVIEGSVRMRSTVLPGLLDAVRLNLNYQRRDINLFEIGKVFACNQTVGELPHESEIFGFAMTGSQLEQAAAVTDPIDFTDAKEYRSCFGVDWNWELGVHSGRRQTS